MRGKSNTRVESRTDRDCLPSRGAILELRNIPPSICGSPVLVTGPPCHQSDTPENTPGLLVDDHTVTQHATRSWLCVECLSCSFSPWSFFLAHSCRSLSVCHLLSVTCCLLLPLILLWLPHANNRQYCVLPIQSPSPRFRRAHDPGSLCGSSICLDLGGLGPCQSASC